MSQSSSNNEEGHSHGERQILDALERARKLKNRVIQSGVDAAASGSDPVDAVNKVAVRYHTAVLDAYGNLRPYIKTELEDEYWDTHEYDYLTTPDGESGLQVLDRWYHPYERHERQQRNRHGGTDVVLETRVNLRPIWQYHKVLDILEEARLQLGFGPSATKKTPTTEITEDDIQEVREWRKQNLE